MTHVLILEDMQASREALSKIMKELSDDIAVSEARTCQEAEKFLDSNTVYDLFLLDINLDMEQPEDRSGVEFAKKLRTRRGYEFTPVVMITSLANLEMEAYRELHCYQYIVKPFFRYDVEEVVNKVLHQKKQPEVSYITVKKLGINYRINCNDIIFIRAISRGVCLYLRHDRLEVPYLTIRKIMEQLPKESFLQCHRMFVVQVKYVDCLDLVNQMIHMKGTKEVVDIGITYKPEVRRRLSE
ncbi:LytTR family DNA-binding domain-containing protein [Lachnospiraceae bacterium OttesenSCG-928-E19]|nr:LytTR family DNA-binding domain-containing protein [Lachnospiraceae bacterium OttesenSCG-928-E19]